MWKSVSESLENDDLEKGIHVLTIIFVCMLQYSINEDRVHEAIFNKSLEEILRHNSGQSSYRMGVNKFTDMTEHEKSAFKGVKMYSPEVTDFLLYLKHLFLRTIYPGRESGILYVGRRRIS